MPAGPVSRKWRRADGPTLPDNLRNLHISWYQAAARAADALGA